MTKPNKQTVETVKTVVIAVFVTAIIAFIGGMHYQSTLSAQLHAAAQTAQVASKSK